MNDPLTITVFAHVMARILYTCHMSVLNKYAQLNRFVLFYIFEYKIIQQTPIITTDITVVFTIL